MRSAFIARNEKVEVKDRSPQKEIQPEGKREAKSRSKRTVGSGIREGSDNCEVLRGKSPTAAATLQGSGKAGRVDAERTVRGNVAIFSSDVAFDSRLFRRHLSPRAREHASRDHRRHHLRREPARRDPRRSSSAWLS